MAPDNEMGNTKKIELSESVIADEIIEEIEASELNEDEKRKMYYDLLEITMSNRDNKDIYEIMATKEYSTFAKVLKLKLDFYNIEIDKNMQDLMKYNARMYYRFEELTELAQGVYSDGYVTTEMSREEELKRFSVLYDGLHILGDEYSKYDNEETNEFLLIMDDINKYISIDGQRLKNACDYLNYEKDISDNKLRNTDSTSVEGAKAIGESLASSEKKSLEITKDVCDAISSDKSKQQEGPAK